MEYVNEMEKYLYNHNYVSTKNNNKKQQELSVERASCIVQKYRTLNKQNVKERYLLQQRIYKARKMIFDNYGVLDKYGIELLDDILKGSEK